MKFSFKIGSVTVKAQNATNPVDVQLNDMEVGIEDLSLLEIPEVINSVKNAIKDIEKGMHDNRMQARQVEYDRQDILHERNVQERKERTHRFEQVAKDMQAPQTPSAPQVEEKPFGAPAPQYL